MEIKQMKRVVGVLLSVAMGAASAAERAVEAMHYEASLSARQYDSDESYDDAKVKYFGVGGEVTLPVAQYVGMSFGADYQRGDTISYPEANVQNEILDGTAGLFVRDPALGRVGVTYGRSRLEAEVEWTDPFYTLYYGARSTSRLYTTTLAGMVEGYSGPVTIGLARSKYDFDGDADNVTTLYGGWYVTTNLLLDVHASMESGEDDTFQLGLEYQPAFFNSMAGVSVSYLHADDTTGIGVTLTFYFDKRFDLMTRDRHYR